LLSYGYDLRLSANEFLIFRHDAGTVMNPSGSICQPRLPALHHDEDGDSFILPAIPTRLGGGLGAAAGAANITVICPWQSTDARLGIIVNTTPAEASWRAPHPGVQ